jgi:hypothetical protein
VSTKSSSSPWSSSLSLSFLGIFLLTFLSSQAASAEPIRVLVTGAAGQIGYALLPIIAKGHFFGPNQKVILHLLDVPFCEASLNGVVLELEDCSYPLLAGNEFFSCGFLFRLFTHNFRKKALLPPPPAWRLRSRTSILRSSLVLSLARMAWSERIFSPRTFLSSRSKVKPSISSRRSLSRSHFS